MRKASAPPALATLILMTATSTVTLNMIVPSLANIARDLEADYALVSLALGGYLTVSAVVQLSVGPLADRIGRRPVLLAALGIFTLASLGCAMAQTVWMLLGFRMLQAAVVSGSVLSLAIVRDTAEEAEAARLLGRIGMAMALAPMLGPMLGSVLDAAFGWRMVFLLYATAGAGLLCLAWSDVGETMRPPADAGQDGTRLTALLREPVFWCYALCTAFSTGAFYIFLAGAPLVATRVFGIGTAKLGAIVGSITAGFMAGAWLGSRLVGRHPPATVMLMGRMLACLGLLVGLAIIAMGYLTPALYFGCTIFVGLGNGMTTPNSNAGAMSVRPRLAGSAAGITGALTVLGGALTTTLTGLALSGTPSPMLLLGLMLLSSFIGLLAAAAAIRLNRLKPNPAIPGPADPS
ncbi:MULTISPECIES: Bcr/CflA family efflux MFS transporter [Inquilinus]|uniref:Bcr/CflA family efflux transporter n=1 Tax=Inquilinus ginsengisoli TaxID=363840 RepID=A0ABU1JPY9_9PROT|nr:Bcr/CflA family efflux MFS transporter [Inquilinus ginsengisoli]MDR6290084.1 Bcr/CflA subfamily drug resistance transporter [Inquilinus ginsengisoli]